MLAKLKSGIEVPYEELWLNDVQRQKLSQIH